MLSQERRWSMVRDTRISSTTPQREIRVSLTCSQRNSEKKAVKLLRLPAADRLGLKLSTLRDWRLKRKYLDFVEIGRAVAVTEESLERLIQANLIPAREGW